MNDDLPTRGSPWRLVPFGVQVAAAWAAVVLLVGFAAAGVVMLLAQVRVVVWALVAALLVCAILDPFAARLRAAGVRRYGAAAIVFVGFLVAVLGALALIGNRVARQFDELGTQLSEGLDELRDWVDESFGISGTELEELAEQARSAVEDNAGGLAGSFSAVAGTAGEIVSGTVLTLFLVFFFLGDGRRMWDWVVGLFPRGARGSVEPAGTRAWGALVAYMRGIVVVALADATLIAIALAVLGVPLVLPLAVLTFLGAFIPLVGATLAGAAAVLVALVTQGSGTALVLLAIVLAVQWLDSDLLQPLILSRAVDLHPVAVALAVTTGGLVAGIGGAVAATPLVAAVHAMTRRTAAAPQAQRTA